MNELALFAGAGGGLLAAKQLGHTIVCAVEKDEYAREVLLRRQRDGWLDKFPIWDDVTTFDGTKWRGKVDVISGGFPCQDISAAGKGAGITGERSGLWGHMARIVGEVRPSYVFVENSPLLVSRGLGLVLLDLASLGYDARWGIVGADDAGAPHRRDRMWVVCSLNVGQTAFKSDDGELNCSWCRLPVFGGCDCWHGEWVCQNCGEWTYPFYYDYDDGCQHCGSSNVSYTAS